MDDAALAIGGDLAEHTLDLHPDLRLCRVHDDLGGESFGPSSASQSKSTYGVSTGYCSAAVWITVNVTTVPSPLNLCSTIFPALRQSGQKVLGGKKRLPAGLIGIKKGGREKRVYLDFCISRISLPICFTDLFLRFFFRS